MNIRYLLVAVATLTLLVGWADGIYAGSSVDRPRYVVDQPVRTIFKLERGTRTPVKRISGSLARNSLYWEALEKLVQIANLSPERRATFVDQM